MANDVPIFTKYPGREKEINLLLGIIPDSEDLPKSNSFVIEGPPSTGKTSIILEVLHFKNQPYVFIDCYESYNSVLLYKKILEELFGNCEELLSITISTLYGFFAAYRKALRLFSPPQVQYIVFKHFNNLEKSVINDIRFLEAKFPDVWGFCSIFIVTDGTFFDVCIPKILKIHFSRYSKDQLREILLLKREEFSVDIYRSFVQIFLPWIYEKERNLLDLLRLVDFLFPIYKKPIDDRKMSLKEPQMLFKHITPCLQKYADPTSILLFNRINGKNDEDVIDMSERFSKVDLPFCTKYLLLAAYLASYIPSKDDRLLFCRRAFKKKKNSSRKKARSSDNEVNLLTGPKPFPLNRLLAIYFSIVEERSNISATLLSQVASLVELKLLMIYGKDENIDEPCYKCVAKLNLVLTVAKTVKFDLEKFFSG